MNTTYVKNGSIYGRFSQKRQTGMEWIGRGESAMHMEHMGATVEDNDIDANGNIDFNKTDLRATFPSGKVVYVEAATKGDDIWKFVFSGVDVEKRKLKYGKMVVFMVKEDTTEALIIPGSCLQAAQRDCGEEYKGHNHPWSQNFVMPDHGCHRVRKRCKQEDGSFRPEDFYRIPFKYVTHLRKVGGKFKIVKTNEPMK